MTTLSCLTVVHGPTPSLWPMLDSLRRTTDPTDTEIVVVVQPSAEGSMAEEIAHRARDVSLVELDHNAGFGGGNDIAADIASGDFLALLNPDLELTEGWTSPLVDALDDPNVTVVAPPLIDETGRVLEAGQAVLRDGWTFPLGGPTWPGPYDSYMFSRDVDYCSAACWLVRRADYAGIGGFDDAFHPAYFEDVDFAFRVWRSGGRCRLVTGRPVIHHHEPASQARLDLAQRAHGVFVDKWADELSRQPAWPNDSAGWTRVRDHRVVTHRVFEAGAELDRDAADAVAAAAGAMAAGRPDERVTIRTPRRSNIEEWRRRWCTRGLEIEIVEP